MNREIAVGEISKELLYVANNDQCNREIYVRKENERDIRLDYANESLVFSRAITPFYFKDCQNVSICNLRLSFKNRYYFQAEIVNIVENTVFLKPNTDVKYEVSAEGKIKLVYEKESLDYAQKTVFIQEFEKVPRVARKSPIKILPPNEEYAFRDKDGVIEFTYKQAQSFKIGNLLCFFCFDRTVDGFVFDHVKNLTLKNVTIYASPAMGIICQNCENIRLENVRVVREENSPYAVTTLADATHFFACRGKLVMQNCTFENMNDDATNIHSAYLTITQTDGKRVVAEYKHFQQYGVNFFKNGDVARSISPQDGAFGATGKVKSAQLTPNKQGLLIEFYHDVPFQVGDLLENVTANPKVRIKNCKTGNNRPRGFLIATNKTALVKDCQFYNSECGVGVFADTKFWYEAGALGKLTIDGCQFSCNYGGERAAIIVEPTFDQDGNPRFNQKITVKNCTFDLRYGERSRICNTEKIVIKNNKEYGNEK